MKANTKKKSPMKKLMPAAGSLMISAAMLGTSTYAWFTMNKEVTVTGMTMHTKVSENLLIADDTIDSTAVKGDQYFNNSLVQLVDGFIEPVSTVNGKNYFYTAGTNVQGNGAVLNKTWTEYNPANLTGFKQQYALESTDNAVGYVDYVYQLKAINGATPSEIRLTGLKLTYGGEAANNQKATRVAVFAENLGYKTGSADHTVASKGNFTDNAVELKAIYTPSGYANFSYEEGTVQTAGDTGYDAVNSTTTRGDVVYNGAFTLDVDTNHTQYYKILVRVWLEGEDTTCNNTTFMDLTDKWSLDMSWEFTADSTSKESGAENAVVPVSNIELAYTATKANLYGKSAATTVSYTISGQDYYAITSATLGTEQLYAKHSGTITSSDDIFTITDGLYPTNVTNQCEFTAP